jgi:DNA-binding transcriptional regulator YiaG
MTSKQIKSLRRALGITQKQLADMIGATQVTIARYETDVSRPTGAYLKLLKILNEQATKKVKSGEGAGRRVNKTTRRKKHGASERV